MYRGYEAATVLRKRADIDLELAVVVALDNRAGFNELPVER